MFRMLAVIKSVSWFDNSTREEYYVLERLHGWKNTSLSIAGGPFETHDQAKELCDRIHGASK